MKVGEPAEKGLASALQRMQNACVANIQVRDVPEHIHKELLRRAERAGQSLQQYLSAQLVAIAATPTLDDFLDQIEDRDKGTFTGADAVEAIRDDRANR